MAVRKTFGANVRKYRDKLGISQEELGYRAGLHRTYVGAVERGEYNCTIINAAKLAQALGCGVVALVRDVQLEEGED